MEKITEREKQIMFPGIVYDSKEKENFFSNIHIVNLERTNYRC